MPATQNRSYPYPTLDNSPNAPLDLQALADAVDSDVQGIVRQNELDKRKLDAATVNPDANTLVERGANGNFFVNEPTDGSNPASKSYVDQRTPTRVFAAQITLSTLPNRDERVVVTVRPTSAQLPAGSRFVTVSPQAQNSDRRLFAYVTLAAQDSLSAAVWRDDTVTTGLGVNFVAVRMPA